MMAPPPTAAEPYCVMISCPETESSPVPCENATIARRLTSLGTLDQKAHGSLGLQNGLSWLMGDVASAGLMESSSNVPVARMESRRGAATVSWAGGSEGG